MMIFKCRNFINTLTVAAILIKKVNNKEERQERIKLLRRKQERKNQLPNLLEQISIIAEKEISEEDVLTLEEIDNHKISINRFDFAFNYLNISFPREKAAELYELLQLLSKNFEEINYLILPEWADIAVLKVRTDFVLVAFEKLIDLDTNSIYLYSLDYKNGIYIDQYSEWWYLEGKAALRPILELRVFGKEWIKKIAAAL